MNNGNLSCTEEQIKCVAIRETEESSEDIEGVPYIQ